MTTQILNSREPGLLEHSPTLTIRCECGRLRNFKIEQVLECFAARTLTGLTVKTECKHCHRKFEVGLGFHNTKPNFTAALPKFMENGGYPIEDDGSMVEPAQ